MTTLTKPTIDRRATDPDAAELPVAIIDMDRFCNHCGYNLRTLPVYRDDRTGIPVVRCTECGRYQAANDGATTLRPWLNRITALLLWAWILAVLTAIFFLGLGEGALSYATLDELTIRGGATTQFVNNTVVRTWQSMGPLEIDTEYRFYRSFISSILFGSFGLAFLLGLFIVVVLPHWRKIACNGLAVGIPLIAGLLIAGSWYYDAQHLFEWGLPYMIAHAGVQCLGGLLGVALGRPVARLAVCLVFPASVRPRLSYLWLADNKPLPRT